MCRLALYLGPPLRMSALITEPEHSIIHQSVHSREREEPLNGDGFGVAWYYRDVCPEPGVFKDVSPAWNNPNLGNLARMIRSRCLLAHVRAATPGLPVHHLNCHPFRWKTLAMMHNGEVGGFARIKRSLRQRLPDEIYDWVFGSTDSEHLFSLVVEHYERETASNPGQRLADALLHAIEQLRHIAEEAGVASEPSFLNLVVTDGTYAAVSRYVSDPDRTPHSLYIYEGQKYQCENGVCTLSPHGDGAPSMVMIASEPVSADSGWEVVPPQHIAIARAGEKTRWVEIA